MYIKSGFRISALNNKKSKLSKWLYDYFLAMKKLFKNLILDRCLHFLLQFLVDSWLVETWLIMLDSLALFMLLYSIIMHVLFAHVELLFFLDCIYTLDALHTSLC